MATVAVGQRLHWWQEGEQNQALQKQIDAPLLSADPATMSEEEHDQDQDTWAELEAEALRRSRQAATEETESVSFPLNKTASLARYRRFTRFMFTIAVLQFVLLCVMAGVNLYYKIVEHDEAGIRLMPNLFQTMSTLFLIVPIRKTGKWLKEKDTPVLRLSPQGMHIDSIRHRNCFLAWDEITAIKPKRLFHQRYLEISGTNRRRYILEERDLPITIEALACRIDVYKAKSEI